MGWVKSEVRAVEDLVPNKMYSVDGRWFRLYRIGGQWRAEFGDKCTNAHHFRFRTPEDAILAGLDVKELTGRPSPTEQEGPAQEGE
jgi:hypothetical protein